MLKRAPKAGDTVGPLCFRGTEPGNSYAPACMSMLQYCSHTTAFANLSRDSCYHRLARRTVSLASILTTVVLLNLRSFTPSWHIWFLVGRGCAFTVAHGIHQPCILKFGYLCTSGHARSADQHSLRLRSESPRGQLQDDFRLLEELSAKKVLSLDSSSEDVTESVFIRA